MTTTLTNFTSETKLTLSASSLVSTQTSEKKFLGKFTLTNTSSSNVEATFWRISESTTALDGSSGNWIWKETIPAGRTVCVDKLQGHVLGNSMKIQGLATVVDVINVDISGTTET